MESKPADAKTIFLAAMEIADVEARARYLDEACGGDAALKSRVTMLLDARTSAGDFLSEPLTETAEKMGIGAGTRIGYFGDYVLLDEIARGASGVVYRARQSSLGRIVALKMLCGQPDDRGGRRFKAEAQAAAGLNHPNIVPIYEVGEHAGQSYLSMKFIEGGTLASRLSEFRGEPEKAVALMAKVARAVESAHAHGLLHRDIKPGNILLDSAGEPHVTDFGIARRIGFDSELTQTGQIMGTPYYMSPEQARGENVTLTPQTDVYALGAVLYELLGGQRPFTGEGMVEVLKRVVDDAPAPLHSLNAELPRDLEVIVAKCMEKSPAARYGTAAALTDDLERWLRGEPILAQSAGMVVRFAKWVRRSPYQAALFFLSAMLLASWAAFALWASSQKNPPRQALAAPRAPLNRPASTWSPLPLGEPFDIAARITFGSDFVGGWKKSADGIVTSQGLPTDKLISVYLPFHADGDYDVHIEFVIRDFVEDGAERTFLDFPVGDRQMHFQLAAGSGCGCPKCRTNGNGTPLATPAGMEHPVGPVSGFRRMGNKALCENSTAVHRHRIAPDVPHRFDLKVRYEGATASAEAILDGQPLSSWRGPMPELTQPDFLRDWAANASMSYLHIANQAYTVDYRKFTVTPINGWAWKRLDPGQR